jgi:hypothetical protein
MDPEVIKAIDGIVREVAPPLISVAGVWLGWRLGTNSQWKQRRLDNLQNRLAAHKEVMSVATNVPPDLSVIDLKAKYATEPEYCKNLNHRLIRLFGLRTELTPYLEPEVRRFIDTTFRPLFSVGLGSYEPLLEKLDGLAHAAIELRYLAWSVEAKLIAEHERLVR